MKDTLRKELENVSLMKLQRSMTVFSGDREKTEFKQTYDHN